MEEKFSIFNGKPFYFKILVLILLILLGTTLVGGLGFLTVSNIFGLNSDEISNGLNNLDGSIPANAVRILQGFFSLGTFLVPALAFSQLSKHQTSQFFGFKQKVPAAVWVLVFMLMITASPFIDGLVYINMHLPYPDFLSEFINKLIAQQETLTQQMEFISASTTFSVLLINLLVMAVIPAIGEEWLFRGVIQKLFVENNYGVHRSVWLTAFFFALLHQSIFFFIGLWVLGALLGYLKEWSGNIWLPVFGHFVNNSIILIVGYLYPELIGELESITFDWLPFVLSTIVSGALLYGVYYFLIRIPRSFINPPN